MKRLIMRMNIFVSFIIVLVDFNFLFSKFKLKNEGTTVKCFFPFLYLGHLTVQRNDNKKREKDVIGCGIDNVSNVIVFTRNGERLERPFYFAGCKCINGTKKILQPTVQVIPKCEEGKDLQLPSLTLTFNFGQKEFEYTRSLKELFEITILENQLMLPPKMSTECPLIYLNE